MKDIPVLVWALAIVFVCTIFGSTQAMGLEAEGKARSKDESLQNAYISAHFKCNRKRLWQILIRSKSKTCTQLNIKLLVEEKVLLNITPQ